MIGKFQTAIEEGFYRIQVASSFGLLISVNEQPVVAIKGNFARTLRLPEGKLSIDPADPKKDYHFECSHAPLNRYDKVDDLPPPQPAPPTNWLAQMRAKVRQSMGVMREDFAERSSIYETDAQLFEEDETRIAEAKKTKAKAEAKRLAQEEADKAKQTTPEPTTNPPQTSVSEGGASLPPKTSE